MQKPQHTTTSQKSNHTEHRIHSHAASLKVFIVFFVLFGAQASAWLVGVPLLSASDEPAHIMTAAADARLELRKPRATGDTLPTTEVVVPRTFALTQAESYCYALSSQPINCQLNRNDCKAQWRQGILPCSTSLEGGSIIIKTRTYTGDYPPLYYFFTGLPTLLSSRPGVIYAMRAVSALMGVAFIAIAAYAIYKYASSTLMLAGLSLSLSPVVLYMVSVVNPSGLEVSSALCLWVVGLLATRESFEVFPRLLGLFACLSASVLVLSRADGLEWALIIVAILALMSVTKQYKSLLINRNALTLIGVWVAACLVALVWNIHQHASVVLPGQLYPQGTSPFAITRSVLGASFIYISQMIGLLGWNNAPVPFVTTLIWYAGIGSTSLLALSALSKKTIRSVGGFISLGIVIALIPIVYTIIYAHTYGDILQGRYLLPGAVGIAIVGSIIASPMLSNVRAVTRTIVALVAIGNIAAYSGVLRRYSVGLSAFDVFKKQAMIWKSPLPVSLLIVLFLLVNLCSVFWYWKMADSIQMRLPKTNRLADEK
jgi:hypothetical protein